VGWNGDIVSEDSDLGRHGVFELCILQSQVMGARVRVSIHGMNSTSRVTISVGFAGNHEPLALFWSSLPIERCDVVAEPEDVGCGGDKMRYELRGFDSVAYVCSR